MLNLCIIFSKKHPCCRSDHSNFGILTGKLSDNVHRLPERQNHKLDVTRRVPSQQIGSLEPVYLAELRNNRLLKVLDVIVRPFTYCRTSLHPSNHAGKPPSEIGYRILKIDNLKLAQYCFKNRNLNPLLIIQFCRVFRDCASRRAVVCYPHLSMNLPSTKG